MHDRRTSSPAGRLTVVALLVAVVGIVVQILAGIDYPPVPPGVLILLAAAAIVAFGPWRASPLAGALVGLFLIFGFVVSGALANLASFREIGAFVGTWVQLLAVVVATLAGLLATVANYRNRREPSR